MLIDAHQHFWLYDPFRLEWISPGMEALRRDWLPVDLTAPMSETGINATIAVQATGDDAETAFLMAQAAANPWIAGVVGWTDLGAADAEQRITACEQLGPLVGLRHQIEDDPTCLNDGSFDAGVAAVQRHGLVYEVLVNHHQLRRAVPFCGRHDAHTLVLDHLAKPAIRDGDEAFAEWRETLAQLAQMPHVMAKISGLATETRAAQGQPLDIDGIHQHLDVALALFGEDRLIFGSDWPVCQLATDYETWFALVSDWAQAQGTDLHRKLFGDNARTVYGLTIQGTTNES